MAIPTPCCCCTRTLRHPSPHSPRHARHALLPALLLCVAAAALHHRADAKLITGLAPCPSGAPPARECLVSVLVDLRALRARAAARERNNTKGSLTPSTKDTALESPQQELPPPPPQELPPLPPPPQQQQPGDDEDRRQQQQQRRQQQLEQAVRFQEDELQQLREQVQDLRLQLARALQLYQLTSPQGVKSPPLQVRGGGYYPPPGPPAPLRAAPDLRAGYTGYGPAHEQAARRFYRTLPPAAPRASPRTAPRTAPGGGQPSTPVFGQRLSLVGLRELARGEAVVAT